MFIFLTEVTNDDAITYKQAEYGVHIISLFLLSITPKKLCTTTQQPRIDTMVVQIIVIFSTKFYTTAQARHNGYERVCN